MPKIYVFDSNYEKLAKLAAVQKITIYEVVDEFMDEFFDTYRKNVGVTTEQMEDVKEW